MNAIAKVATADLLYDPQAFGHALQLSEALARSSLIPEAFRGKPSDVLLAITIAQQQGQHPLLVMQSLYVISGKAGWSAQYIIAQANASGKLRGPIRWRYEGEGDDLSVTAYATLAETGDEIAHTVSMAMARAEGWTKRNPKYQTMGKLMLSYRSATLLVRLHCPDVLMGLHTRDELVDISGEPELIEPPRARIETLRPSPSSARALQDASRPAPAPDRAGPSAPVAGPPIAVSPSSPAPRGGDPTRVEAAPEPTEGELQERAAIMAGLLRMAEPRRKAAAERAGCGGRKASTLTLPELRRILAETIEPWQGQPPALEELLTQLADLTIDLEPYATQRADCARAAGLPLQDGEAVVDGAPEAALLRYLTALRTLASELGVGR